MHSYNVIIIVGSTIMDDCNGGIIIVLFNATCHPQICQWNHKDLFRY